MEPPFDYIPHTLFLGSGSPLRKKYDREKEEKGLDKLLEDNTEIGYSNYHDTYRFYSWLKDNREFVINTICEFMAASIIMKNLDACQDMPKIWRTGMFLKRIIYYQPHEKK